MQHEADFKKAFKKSVREAGGFSLSLSTPAVSGIPDLFVVMPSFIPITIEAKFIKDIKSDKFRRKINYSPMQRLWLDKCHKIQPYSVMGLIGLKLDGAIFAVLCDAEQTHISDYNLQPTSHSSIVPYESGRFNIKTLFAYSKVPKLG